MWAMASRIKRLVMPVLPPFQQSARGAGAASGSTRLGRRRCRRQPSPRPRSCPVHPGDPFLKHPDDLGPHPVELLVGRAGPRHTDPFVQVSFPVRIRHVRTRRPRHDAPQRSTRLRRLRPLLVSLSPPFTHGCRPLPGISRHTPEFSPEIHIAPRRLPLPQHGLREALADWTDRESDARAQTVPLLLAKIDASSESRHSLPGDGYRTPSSPPYHSGLSGLLFPACRASDVRELAERRSAPEVPGVRHLHRRDEPAAERSIRAHTGAPSPPAR